MESTRLPPSPSFSTSPIPAEEGEQPQGSVLLSLPALCTSPHYFIFILGNMEEIYEGKTEHGLSTTPHLLLWKRQNTENALAVLGCQP